MLTYALSANKHQWMNRLRCILRQLWLPTLLAAICAESATFGDDTLESNTSAIDFDRDVRPIITIRCLKCHGPDEPEAGLNLTSRQSALDAGAIAPGRAVDSSLLDRVTSEDESTRMPPEGEPLSPTQIETLTRWIESGADWPGHWAYKALELPAVPQPTSAELREWCLTPIDAFIAEGLEDAGLAPSPRADRLTLLRRASFDLRGLPPTPEEVDAFLNDDSPDAWERSIDRLLASPHYGERWARHWMDLVHFAETHGHDQDRPREHAWPYRDYLIRSFNADKPYGQFVAEQIAGDVIDPFNPDAIVATGFLASGPWDESSLRDIREDSIDREIGRYLDRDDIVTTVMSTFASTSVHCARCHDHKFDPITQDEYYGLQAVFAGTDKANRPFDADPQVAARRSELQQQRDALANAFAENPDSLWTPDIATEITAWEERLASESVLWRPLQYDSFTSQQGATLRLLDDASVLAEGTRPDTDVYIVEGRTPLTRVTAIRLDVLIDESLPQQGPGRQDNGNLHLNEFHAFQILNGNVDAPTELALQAPFADWNQDGWAIEAAVDRNDTTAWGIFPQVSKSHFAVFPLETIEAESESVALRIELHQIHGAGHLIGRFRLSVTDAPHEQLCSSSDIPFAVAEILTVDRNARSPEQLAGLAHWYLIRQIETELAALPPQQLVYSGTSRFDADGTFRPAPAPRTIHVLHRGLISDPLHEAQPGALSCLEELSGTLAIDALDNEGERRRGLALWLSDHHNPLVWRSIANRVWQWHFGQGLVDTPNDFGQMGSSPTHPELLDWLAVTLQESNGSLKELHRLILTSAVYQQTSNSRDDAEVVDAGNRYLWRMNRQRLDAESFRDALLVASGTLDATMGGPSERQFIQTPGVHVTPVVDYQNFDVDDPANYRRSVYRFIFRTIPDPFMEALDCPDASQLTPQRNVSLTALQALATLNDKFVVRQSELLAERLLEEHADLEQQITAAYRRLFGRVPEPDELMAVRQYAEQHGLANACRFLFNTNEFLFVD